jgi:hypothetical protein
MAIISNLPTSMLAASIIFENESKFTDVTPAVKPFVDMAEADSNRASSKLVLDIRTKNFCMVWGNSYEILVVCHIYLKY